MHLARRKPVALILLLLVLFMALLAGLVWREVRQSRLDHALIAAVRKNNAKAMAVLLKRGADPNAHDVPLKPLAWRDLLTRWLHRTAASRADTALLLAARQEEDFGDAKLLIQAGANVNAANAVGDTPLAEAVEHALPEVILALLAHGANPNTKVIYADGTATPVVVRIVENFIGSDEETLRRHLITTLLERGADVKATGTNGETALREAVLYRDADLVKLLLEHGANPNQQDKRGLTPLQAASYGDAIIMETLLRRNVDVSPARNSGWNLLAWAAETDNGKILKTALSRGISVNSRDRHGRTALMFAAAYSNRAMVTALLAQGAKVDSRDDQGWTALMFAAQRGDPDIIRMLLAHGANPQLRDRDERWTPAQRAMNRGQEQFARMLLTAGTAFDSRTGTGKTVQTDYSDDPGRSRMRLPLYGGSHMDLTISEPDATDNRSCKVTIVDAGGISGRPLIMPFIFMPKVALFADTDGHRYACFTGHHRTESIYLEAIHGRELAAKWQLPQEMGTAWCQPLPGGGALITRIRRNRYMATIPARHTGDQFAEVFRFRNGKISNLGLIILPQQ